jgi:hypothetical protein
MAVPVATLVRPPTGQRRNQLRGFSPVEAAAELH